MTKKLVKVSLPKSSSDAFKRVHELLKRGWIDVPEEYTGTGAPGNYLEDLVNGTTKTKNNRDSPDYKDWEVKFHGGGALVTLFHKDPEPKGVTRSILHEHGYLNSKNQVCFRHTIRGRSKRGFYVVNSTDRIIVRHETKDSVVPVWRHNTLFNAMGAKLRRFILVDGKYNKTTRKIVFNTATAYWDFKHLVFFDALQNGIVCIDFDMHTKEGAGTTIRDHGTKFRIKNSDIIHLYENSQKIT